jgi:hypothetical protein
VLPHRVMAPSRLGTFLRAFCLGHLCQLEAVVGRAFAAAWAAGAGPGLSGLVIDVDSTICEVLGYHPILASAWVAANKLTTSWANVVDERCRNLRTGRRIQVPPTNASRRVANVCGVEDREVVRAGEVSGGAGREGGMVVDVAWELLDEKNRWAGIS